MEHTVNLNIHYSVCKETWDKILQVYKSMPYWAGDDKDVKWIGKGIDLWASAERSGIPIAGRMPECIWDEWYRTLKYKLTKSLGYEIGELEEGYDFQ